MSVFGNIRRRLFGPRDEVSSAEIRRGDRVFEAFTGGADGVGEYSALTISAVYACVNLIAGAIASMPMHVYSRSADGDLSRDTNNALWWTLNEEFCARWPAAAGWSFLVGSKLLHGDAFAEIIRRGRDGQIAGIVPIHPNRVRVVATPDGSRLVYEVQPDSTITSPTPEVSRMRVIDQDDMLHVPGFGFNGLRGMSPLRCALSSVGNVALNAQKFSDRFLKNMGRPDYALKANGQLTDAQFDRLRDTINAHSGPENAGKPMILEGGLEIQTLTMPMEEMQLLETRKFQVEEIARVYGVPPFAIGHTEKTSSWGTGVSAMGAGFVRFTLRDHLNAFQNEINRKFFRTARYVAEFDTAELERADIGALTTALRTAIGRAGEPAIISVEEARNMLRLPRKMAGSAPPTPKELQEVGE